MSLNVTYGRQNLVEYNKIFHKRVARCYSLRFRDLYVGPMIGLQGRIFNKIGLSSDSEHYVIDI